jgi:UDP-N-acetylmuramoyl-tripeptide--D-alanyl-D-alanine ligase
MKPPDATAAAPGPAEAAPFWRLDVIAQVIGGHWLVQPADDSTKASGVSIDTRTIEPGAVFFAIPGERVDGHAFIGDALTQGAAAAVVQADHFGAAQRPSLPGHVSGGVLAVADPVAALQALASAYRDVLARVGTTVIAVGGSNGKTTTRALIHRALSAAMPGRQAPKSFNNHLGVPLTLLSACVSPPAPPDDTNATASPADRFVVCEIGTNHPGEIAALARLVRPDVAVLTSLGREHLEHFGSVEAVAAEEARLLEHVADPGTTIVEAEAWRTLQRLDLIAEPTRCITFGETRQYPPDETPPDWTITAGPELIEGRQRFTVNGRWSVELALMGGHNARNALAALAVGHALGIEVTTLASALRDAAPVPGRMQLRRFGSSGDGVTVIDDAYNANPDSMRAAMKTLMEQAPETGAKRNPRRIAVLGEMGELGAASEPEHRALGDWLAERGDHMDAVMTIGPAAKWISEPIAAAWGADRVAHFETLDEPNAAAIASHLKPGDWVLLKASRSVALERVLPAIEARFDARP